jgi:hypothetical protein
MAAMLLLKPAGQHAELPEYVFTQGEIAVGRDPSNDLVLGNMTISRKHAVMMFAGGRWFLADLGSKNGTSVNSRSAKPDCWAVLRSQDVVQFGELAFYVDLKQDGLTAYPHSVIVFTKNQYHREIAFESPDASLCIGGPQSGLGILAIDRGPTILTLRDTGSGLTVTPAVPRGNLLLNGGPLHSVTDLGDGDMIRHSDLTMLIHYSQALTGERAEPAPLNCPPRREEGFKNLAGWNKETRTVRRRRSVFGEDIDSLATMSLPKSLLAEVRRDAMNDSNAEMAISTRMLSVREEWLKDGNRRVRKSVLGLLVLLVIAILWAFLNSPSAVRSWIVGQSSDLRSEN